MYNEAASYKMAQAFKRVYMKDYGFQEDEVEIVKIK